MEHEPLILNEHHKAEFPPMHTCEHILNATMVRMFGCERSKDAHIERKKSKINYELPEPPTEAQIAEIAERVNAVIAADVPVTYEYVKREDVPADVPLDKLPAAADGMLRLVRIGDYDVCACIGAHVASTGVLGRFQINSTSYKENRFRIVFKLPEAKAEQ